MISKDVVVLGGGWAGVVYSLECKLRSFNVDIIVLEKQERVGGLLKSVVIEGHVFDIGGSHIIFSRNKVILSKMLNILNNNNVSESFRKAFIILNHGFIPYPLENNLHVLSQSERFDALISFLEAWMERSSDFVPKNLKEWIYGFFGRWIAEKYLVPYNLKIWKRPLEEMDVDWVYTPGRLPIPDWRDVVKSALGQPTVGYSEQARFYYPQRGGIQTLFDKAKEKVLRAGVQYLKGYEITSIRRIKDGWLINDEIRAKRLVSSIPLNELVRLMNAPEHIVKLANRLDYNRVLVVGLAIDKPAPDQHWVYVPDSRIVFHRYAWISNYSPYNAPPGKSTLIAEITIPPSQPVNIEKYVEETIEGLEKLEIITSDDVRFARAWLHEYAYPLHTIASNKARNEIVEWLHEQGVTLIGRWGCWRYWNMDKVYEEILNILKSC